MSLKLPLHFNLPMAPAEGLYLKTAGFMRNSHRHIAMSADRKGHQRSVYVSSFVYFLV